MFYFLELLTSVIQQKSEQDFKIINLLSESICSLTYRQMKELVDSSFCESILALLKALRRVPDALEKAFYFVERISFVGAHEARLKEENKFYTDFSKTRLLKEIEDSFIEPHDWVTATTRDMAIHSYAFLMKRRMILEHTLGVMIPFLVKKISMNVRDSAQRRAIQRSFFAIYCLVESRSLHFLFLVL